MTQREPRAISLFDTEFDTNGDRTISVTFTLPYHTEPAHGLVITGESKAAVSVPFHSAMSETEPGIWQTTVELDADKYIELKYTYTVQDGDVIIRSEPLYRHGLRLQYDPILPIYDVRIDDLWCEPSSWHRFMDQPLASLMDLKGQSNIRMPSIPLTFLQTLVFRTEHPLPGDLLLCGDHPTLGAWDPEKALPLTHTRYGYTAEIDHRISFEYKLVLKDPDGTYRWETGENRHHRPGGTYLGITYQAPPHFDEIEAPEVKQIEGTVLPLFSLRTDRSYGVGDLGDAVEFVCWLRHVGHRVYQMLPIYDTIFTETLDDTYPYNAITTFGIHPIYMDIRRLPHYMGMKERKRWEKQAKELNALPQVDYQATLKLKLEVIKKCYAEWMDNKGNKDQSFQVFCEKHKENLLPYCLFCSIRDANPGMQVEDFPQYSTFAKAEKGEVYTNERLLPYAYAQYFLYKQLEELNSYAKKVGVALKGDLPIGVGRNSVDVWQHPEYFHLDYCAGSPPDFFSADGQNWGFPTYNWDAIAKDGYSWWQKRFSAMEEYISMIRVDHILGFFRIWSIPTDSGQPGDGHYVPAVGYDKDRARGLEPYFTTDDKGLLHPMLFPQLHPNYSTLADEKKARLHEIAREYYESRNEHLWRSTAYKRLTAVLRSTKLLICAEDLGVLPHTIHEVLEALDLVTLEVIRMPKKLGSTFVLPQDIPALSVLTTSTHDMSGLRGWWSDLSEDQKKELAFLYGFEEDLTPAGLVRALRRMPSHLLILPLQDWCVLSGYGSEVDPADEQINHPEDPHNIWNYRMVGTIDNLPNELI